MTFQVDNISHSCPVSGVSAMRVALPSLNIAPNTVRYVTLDEFQRKVDLYKAKYRRVLCALLSLLILMLIFFSVSLNYHPRTTVNQDSTLSTAGSGFGFSCVYQPKWTNNGTITYTQRKTRKNIPDDSFDLENGTFTVEAEGIYHVTYSFSGDLFISANVSVLVNEKQEEGGRSLYLLLDQEDKLSLKCSNCNKITRIIQQVYFCVAFIP